MPELHKIPNKTWVKVMEDVKVPPAAPPINKGDIIFFDHLDGMYSYCKTPAGKIVHMAAWTKVKVVKPPEGIIVHALLAGKTLCQRLPPNLLADKMPCDWPEGHLWTYVEDLDNITCEECKNQAVGVKDAKDAKDN